MLKIQACELLDFHDQKISKLCRFRNIDGFIPIQQDNV